VCLQQYQQLGYIPQGCSDADVSRSMNYWHADYALSRAATELAKQSGSDSPPNMPNISYAADAKILLANSNNWKKLLDPATAHFRVKNSNGSFPDTFDEFAWGPRPGYTEAGPWQYREPGVSVLEAVHF
jgi:putative alpha-1,2-mannosidase